MRALRARVERRMLLALGPRIIQIIDRFWGEYGRAPQSVEELLQGLEMLKEDR